MTELPHSRPARVVIEQVTPEVDGGRFAVKRLAGDKVTVEAVIFLEGHEELACQLLYRRVGYEGWQEVPLRFLGNDVWQGEFVVAEVGEYSYRIEAWPDPVGTWQRDLRKWFEAGEDVSLELQSGAALLRDAASRAEAGDADRLRQRADALERPDWAPAARVEMGLDALLAVLTNRCVDPAAVTTYDRGQRVIVERERAGFSAWYELFPRSTSTVAGRPGTFRDCIARLYYVAGLGFDVLYLPPIHPIGLTKRKGKNNAPVAAAGDAGSPWGIGAGDGGHKAVNPDLGTLADFHDLVAAARAKGMEVALDIAYQCSPDHPWVREHPDWFRHRPDGSIRYAENPPKRYEDIYPIDFETADWRALWQELASVVRYWIDQGVRIFRIDNPHTKQFDFWEWCIESVRADHPDVIFLAEAFTRPHPMQLLAKAGFSQSYTYFTWRNTKAELTQYLLELTCGPERDFFRPNFWPNTPDILHEYLQTGGRPAFIARAVLAATLSANWGVYGPAYELCENVAREPGSEEYLNSEKYEQRHWDLDAPESIADFLRRLNLARRENAALQRTDTLRFLEVDNDQIIAYAKTSERDENTVVVVVNLNPFRTQAGTLRLPLAELGLSANEPYQMHDLLVDARYTWHGEANYVELDPRVVPSHVFRLRPRQRRENDFDYFT